MSDPVAIDEFVTVETERPPQRRDLHAREERRARLAFEFRGDDALFRLVGPPDAFTGIEGGAFTASDGRRFRISWVKHLVDEEAPTDVQHVYRAIALARRLS